jgi:hypothetical protein
LVKLTLRFNRLQTSYLFIMLFKLSIFASLAAAAVSTNATSSVYSGLGTWYGENCGESACWQNGACAFVDYVLPATIDGSTCVSEDIWNNGYHCGACVEIMYKGKKKIAMVRGSLLEYCPSEIRLITILCAGH